MITWIYKLKLCKLQWPGYYACFKEKQKYDLASNSTVLTFLFNGIKIYFIDHHFPNGVCK